MDYAMISRVEKAKLYAEERRERVQFREFSAIIIGEQDTHAIALADGKLTCDCSFFRERGHCAHTLTMERVLDGMIALNWD
jgi:hypothetical protein